MTARIGTEGPVVGAMFDPAVTTVAIRILFLGQFVVNEREVLCVVAAGTAHIRQIQQ